MADKIVEIITKAKKTHPFIVTETGGKYTSYKAEHGAWSGYRAVSEIGQSKNFDDALAIIKSSVDGAVEKVNIKDR